MKSHYLIIFYKNIQYKYGKFEKLSSEAEEIPWDTNYEEILWQGFIRS